MALVDVIQNSTNRSINKVHNPASALLPQHWDLFFGGGVVSFQSSMYLELESEDQKQDRRFLT